MDKKSKGVKKALPAHRVPISEIDEVNNLKQEFGDGYTMVGWWRMVIKLGVEALKKKIGDGNFPMFGL